MICLKRKKTLVYATTKGDERKNLDDLPPLEDYEKVKKNKNLNFKCKQTIN